MHANMHVVRIRIVPIYNIVYYIVVKIYCTMLLHTNNIPINILIYTSYCVYELRIY